MKNYDALFQEEIANIEGRPKLLLHVCCGPCCSNVVKELHELFDITIYYSNSNIYPEAEYDRRYEELCDFIKRFNEDYNDDIEVFEDEYNYAEYYEHLSPVGVLGEGSVRCRLCYALRMERAHRYAKKNHFDYWTTVLSVSPHKNSQWINEIGEPYNQKDDTLRFLHSDFKKRDGYKKSVEMAKEYGLYRQNYCGCSFSYKEMLEREKRKEAGE